MDYKIYSSDDDFSQGCKQTRCFNCMKQNCPSPHIHIQWDGKFVDGYCSEKCAIEAVVKKAGTSEMAVQRNQ